MRMIGFIVLLVCQVAIGAERPNIVLILADDLGYSDLGCFGSEIATPHLDALAAGGIRFTQMHNTAKCFPSRACLLTGVYAQHCNLWRTHANITDAITLGEALRSAGYRTLMVGKHHGTDNPFDRGFDRYWGLRDGACNHFNPGRQRPGEPAPAQKRSNRTWCFDDKTVVGYSPPEKDFYTTDTFTRQALAFLDEAAQMDKPFLLYLAYTAPHDPLMAWPDDIARYKGRYDQGFAPVRQRRYQRQLDSGLLDAKRYPLSEPTHRGWDAMTPEQRADQARRMEVYAAMIDRLDQKIGEVVAKLKQIGAFENTLILFASDNGASAEDVQIGTGPIGAVDRWSSLQGDWANVCNTPFRYYKNDSFQGGICTPLVAHWPAGIVKPGRIDHTVLHFVDFMPTFLELARATYPGKFDGQKLHPLDGHSFVGLLRHRTFERDEPLFWNWRQGQAVLQDGYKLVRGTGHRRRGWELYHLTSDRTECHNVIAEHPEVAERLKASYARWEATWKE